MQLATSLLQAAMQQPQISAGVRTKVVLEESLHSTWQLVQSLHGMLLENEDIMKDLASHHTALLMLALLEAQLQQLQDNATSSAAAPAVVGLPASGQSAGAAASSSSAYVLQHQQHWQEHGSSASEQQYRDSLLHALGLPTGRQQWEQLCRTASSSRSSSSNDRDCSGVLDPSIPLQVVSSFLPFWFIFIVMQWARADDKKRLAQYQQHCQPRQAVLSLLPSRLLSCAALNLPVPCDNSFGSTHHVRVLQGSSEAAEKAVMFRLIAVGPALKEVPPLDKHQQQHQVPELLQVSALLLSLAAAAGPAAGDGSSSGRGSFVRSASSLAIGNSTVSIMENFYARCTHQRSKQV